MCRGSWLSLSNIPTTVSYIIIYKVPACSMLLLVRIRLTFMFCVYRVLNSTVFMANEVINFNVSELCDWLGNKDDITEDILDVLQSEWEDIG